MKQWLADRDRDSGLWGHVRVAFRCTGGRTGVGADGGVCLVPAGTACGCSPVEISTPGQEPEADAGGGGAQTGPVFESSGFTSHASSCRRSLSRRVAGSICRMTSSWRYQEKAQASEEDPEVVEPALDYLIRGIDSRLEVEGDVVRVVARLEIELFRRAGFGCRCGWRMRRSRVRQWVVSRRGWWPMRARDMSFWSCTRGQAGRVGAGARVCEGLHEITGTQ